MSTIVFTGMSVPVCSRYACTGKGYLYAGTGKVRSTGDATGMRVAVESHPLTRHPATTCGPAQADTLGQLGTCSPRADTSQLGVGETGTRLPLYRPASPPTFSLLSLTQPISTASVVVYVCSTTVLILYSVFFLLFPFSC